MNEEHVEAMRETAKHIRTVQGLLLQVSNRLIDRGIYHDVSKWDKEEWPYFAEATSKLHGITYGSDEYKKQLESLKPAIQHHQSRNLHHPEYWGGDITQMSLIDLIEMLADWKAATQRHADGDLAKSIAINTERFQIPDPIVKILTNTAVRLGWMAHPTDALCS